MWHSLYMKVFLLIAHVLSALLQCMLLGLLNKRQRQSLIKIWAILLFKILHIKIKLVGNVAYLQDSQARLIVSNHISWLDIHVLNTVHPLVFVAKADVAAWPIFGWIAKNIGTIFIKREKLSDIKRVLKLMRHELSHQQSVGIFPEGTSSDGRQVLEFRSNLFQAAVDANIQVLPIAIRYVEHGKYSSRAAFVGDMGLLESIKSIIKSNHLVAYIHVGEPMDADISRQALAIFSERQISNVISQ